MIFVPPNGAVATPDRVLDKAALYGNARRAAAGFRALGLGPGGAVAMLLRNDIPFLECVVAANWIGAHIAPVNWHLRGAEVRAILADSGAAVLIVHADLLAEIRPFVPDGVRIVVAEPSPSLVTAYRIAGDAARAPDDLERWEDWIAGFEPVADDPAPGRFTMMYTSGTTAQPKGVTRSVTDRDALEQGRAMVAETFGLWNGMRAIMTGRCITARHSSTPPAAWASTATSS